MADDMTTICEGSEGRSPHEPRVLAADIIGGFGFALTVAWVFLASYSKALVLQPQETESTFALLRLIGGIAFVVGFYALRRFSDALSARSVDKKMLSACIGMGSLLPVLYLVNNVLAPLPVVVVAVGWIGHGLTSAVLFGYWGRFSSMLPTGQIMPTLIAVFFGAGCWYFIVTSLATNLAIGVFLAVMLVSLACFVVYSRESTIPRTMALSDSSIRLDSRAGYLGGALNGVVLGMLLIAILLDFERQYVHLFITGSFVIAVVLTALVFVMRKRRFVSYGQTRRTLFPVFVTSLVCLFFGVGPSAAVFVGILLVSFIVLDIVNWSTVALLGSLYRAQPVYSFSSVRLPFTLGTTAGWAIGYVMLGHAVPTLSVPPESVAALAVVLLAVSISVVPFGQEAMPSSRAHAQQEESTEESRNPGTGLWRRTCISLARTHGLTPREREVFLLLAKGRNAAVIEKELVVSTSTVKTHIYHVYQKLSISSHQELLDMVEREVRETSKDRG